MPQSLSNVLVLIVFSTKHRKPWLRKQELRDAMTVYLVGTLQHLQCPSLIVGVVEDHVHILCNLHRTIIGPGPRPSASAIEFGAFSPSGEDSTRSIGWPSLGRDCACPDPCVSQNCRLRRSGLPDSL